MAHLTFFLGRRLTSGKLKGKFCVCGKCIDIALFKKNISLF